MIMKIVGSKEKYSKEVVPALEKAFGYTNLLAVPRIKKVVVNVGVGRFLKDNAQVEEITKMVTEITGQKPVATEAKKAIAGFKIRQGLVVGMKVTLRGPRMWSFIDRVINATLPRVRDFQGIPQSTVDSNGNLNIGIKEHVVFPEVSAEKMKFPFGLQVTVTSTATSQEEGLQLFRLLGFPIKSSNN